MHMPLACILTLSNTKVRNISKDITSETSNMSVKYLLSYEDLVKINTGSSELDCF